METKNYTGLMDDAHKIKDEILFHLSCTNSKEGFLLDHIPNMLEKYLVQTKQLLWRHKNICDLLGRISLSKIDSSIEELTSMMRGTNDAKLKTQCAKSIQVYKENRGIVSGYEIQKESIEGYLDATIYNMTKIKYDLLRLQGMPNTAFRKEFYSNFEKRSAELSIYLQSLNAEA